MEITIYPNDINQYVESLQNSNCFCIASIIILLGICILLLINMWENLHISWIMGFCMAIVGIVVLASVATENNHKLKSPLHHYAIEKANIINKTKTKELEKIPQIPIVVIVENNQVKVKE